MGAKEDLDELPPELRESLVMELLRRRDISQGSAAEILGISGGDLSAVMERYQLSATESTDELDKEPRKP